MRHLVLILDGFGYDVVEKFKTAGGFRDFQRPSRVVAPFPTLTDLCIQDLLQGEPCEGMEAVYFDQKMRRLSGSVLSYLQFKNQPYSKILDFRSPSLIDGISYIAPWYAFDLELMSLRRQFRRSRAEIFKAYLVSTAGISTKYALDGQLKCLRRVDQFITKLKAQSTDSLMVTLLSDHGHSYYASKLSPFKTVLKAKGWHFGKSLKHKSDAVYTSFGLVNYASFATLDAPRLAHDSLDVPGVEIASYAADDAVRVLAPDGSSASIRSSGKTHSYETKDGDPLGLLPVLKNLTSNNGFYADTDVFDATIEHKYPAPLERLWRAHSGLVKHAPDVIVSLGDEWHSGSAFLNFFATVKSTHGSLNKTNSLAVAISTGPGLLQTVRSREILDHVLKNPALR